MTDITSTVRLRTGADMPRIGLGVFQAPSGEETRNAVLDALRVGYRHFDTAKIYGNEADVGDAIRESGIPRDEIFVTTKLWNDDQGYESALRVYDRQLATLGLETVDLYLMHWPVAEKRLDSWRAMEQLFIEGRVKAIGVSNFMTWHLEELLEYANEVPAVNQIEISPFFQQREVRALCAEHGIVVEAYSPLTKGLKLDDPTVVTVANECRRSPAQVMLRWCLQHDLVVLPKSVHAERIAENFDLYDFNLADEQMARLDALEEGLVTGWDPRTWK